MTLLFFTYSTSCFAASAVAHNDTLAATGLIATERGDCTPRNLQASGETFHVALRSCCR